MKKIFITIAIILCGTFCFSACDNGLSPTYWKDTYTMCYTTFSSDDYQDISNINYSENLRTIINENVAFGELQQIYEPLFNSAISLASYGYKTFNSDPINKTNELKSDIKNVNNALFNLRASIKTLNDAKNSFEQYVSTTQSTPDSEPFSDRLIKYKQKYLEAIADCYELSVAVYNARKEGYKSEVNYYENNLVISNKQLECVFAVNAVNLQIIECVIKVLDKQLNGQNPSNLCNLWPEQAIEFYQDVVDKCEKGTLIPKDNDEEMIKALKKWKGVYDVFCNESNMFIEIIDGIDFKLLQEVINETDVATAYAIASDNQKNIAKINFASDFGAKIEILKTYTSALFNEQ